ncbi:GNAT family N-acetyltransferase [Aliamphritea hakodatensis]|uniref:GNAT family N-acetyltransferase n=1 Tax=Aliamphritea hakodatensis TaxID=2895352 RepID=UPI0022FDAF4D|nr:GNAT family N-acetyltransferase [Aliamphritea hakodatensis]
MNLPDGISVIQAGPEDAHEVARLVRALLLELEPGADAELSAMNLPKQAKDMLADQLIYAFFALYAGELVGVITLHRCAALYAGGVFGEVSERYVVPGYRSMKVGERLLDKAMAFAAKQGWQRLEVGAPPLAEFPRAQQFYEANGFICTGQRLRRLV